MAVCVQGILFSMTGQARSRDGGLSSLCFPLGPTAEAGRGSVQGYCHQYPHQAGGLSLGVLGSGGAGPGSLRWRAGEP